MGIPQQGSKQGQPANTTGNTKGTEGSSGNHRPSHKKSLTADSSMLQDFQPDSNIPQRPQSRSRALSRRSADVVQSSKPISSPSAASPTDSPTAPFYLSQMATSRPPTALLRSNLPPLVPTIRSTPGMIPTAPSHTTATFPCQQSPATDDPAPWQRPPSRRNSRNPTNTGALEFDPPASDAPGSRRTSGATLWPPASLQDLPPRTAEPLQGPGTVVPLLHPLPQPSDGRLLRPSSSRASRSSNASLGQRPGTSSSTSTDSRISDTGLRTIDSRLSDTGLRSTIDSRMSDTWQRLSPDGRRFGTSDTGLARSPKWENTPQPGTGIHSPASPVSPNTEPISFPWPRSQVPARLIGDGTAERLIETTLPESQSLGALDDAHNRLSETLSGATGLHRMSLSADVASFARDASFSDFAVLQGLAAAANQTPATATPADADAQSQQSAPNRSSPSPQRQPRLLQKLFSRNRNTPTVPQEAQEDLDLVITRRGLSKIKIGHHVEPSFSNINPQQTTPSRQRRSSSSQEGPVERADSEASQLSSAPSVTFPSAATEDSSQKPATPKLQPHLQEVAPSHSAASTPNAGTPIAGTPKKPHSQSAASTPKAAGTPAAGTPKKPHPPSLNKAQPPLSRSGSGGSARFRRHMHTSVTGASATQSPSTPSSPMLGASPRPSPRPTASAPHVPESAPHVHTESLFSVLLRHDHHSQKHTKQDAYVVSTPTAESHSQPDDLSDMPQEANQPGTPRGTAAHATHKFWDSWEKQHTPHAASRPAFAASPGRLLERSETLGALTPRLPADLPPVQHTPRQPALPSTPSGGTPNPFQ